MTWAAQPHQAGSVFETPGLLYRKHPEIQRNLLPIPITFNKQKQESFRYITMAG